MAGQYEAHSHGNSASKHWCMPLLPPECRPANKLHSRTKEVSRGLAEAARVGVRPPPSTAAMSASAANLLRPPPGPTVASLPPRRYGSETMA